MIHHSRTHDPAMIICHAMPLGQCREANNIGQDSTMTYQQLL